MVTDLLLSRYNYVVALLLLGIGVYMLVESRNLVKKVIGMNIFQTAIFLVFVTAAYVEGGAVPILEDGSGQYVSPCHTS